MLASVNKVSNVLRIKQITLTAVSKIEKGIDRRGVVSQLPICIKDAGLKDMNENGVISFQCCEFTVVQAEQLAVCIPPNATLKLDNSTLPIVDGRNVFLASLNKRAEPIKLEFFEELPVVGTKDRYEDSARREAALIQLAYPASEGKISKLKLDVEMFNPMTFNHQELVAYCDLKKILGVGLVEPEFLQVHTQSEGTILVRRYHYGPLPAFTPALTSKKKPCRKCTSYYCPHHKSKAGDILKALKINASYTALVASLYDNNIDSESIRTVCEYLEF